MPPPPEPTKELRIRSPQRPSGGSAFGLLEGREKDDLDRQVTLAVEIYEGLRDHHGLRREVCGFQ